ncbi:uncharacterized protein LOC134794453 [Cydia splendana]|uniref:uncharacterized protein LOC134794453 n=1 Tax=Cydia splendana TaxID=1100963 RepID=UPI00300D39DC
MDHLAKLQKSIDGMKAMFESRMASFESSVATQGTEALPGEYSAFKDFVCKAVSSLQNQMEFVSRTLEDMESRSRASILLLHGVPEAQGEDTSAVAVDILQQTLKVEGVTLTACYRLGSNLTPSRPRPVLLKFSCHRIRDAVWAAKKLLKGSGRTLSEFLTSTRHAVFLEARRRYGVKGSWTSDGRIVVQCHDGVRRKVVTLAELEALPAPACAAEADGGVRTETEAVAGVKASSAAVAPRPSRQARFAAGSGVGRR